MENSLIPMGVALEQMDCCYCNQDVMQLKADIEEGLEGDFFNHEI